MHKQILECLDDLRDPPAARQGNRIAHLWGGDVVEARELDRWKASPKHAGTLFVRRTSDVEAVAAEFTDPVTAGLAVLLGKSGEARIHSYVAQHLAEFKQTMEARVEELVNERVEAALADRYEQRRRENPVLQNALERLREKAKRVPLPPAEEVWKTINLLAPDDEED